MEFQYYSPFDLRNTIEGKTEDKGANAIFWVLIIFATVFIFLKGFVFASVYVSGDSMLPNLHDGDYLVGNRLSAYFELYDYGDIVVVNVGEGANGKKIIKRVVGKEGDVISFVAGKLYRNDKLVDEYYIPSETLTTDKGYGGFPYTVQPGEIFVLGDNRGSSADSRTYEYRNIKLSQVYAVITNWSLPNNEINSSLAN